MRIAKTFDYSCAYCGERPEQLQADHVVALARGGPDSLSNILPSCPPCNHDKRELTLAEWAVSRQERHLWPVRTAISDSVRYYHLALTEAAEA